MSHTFTLNLLSDAKTTLGRVQELLISSGGTFSGDLTNGEFTGSGVTGLYHVEDNIVTIKITKKPFIAPMALVEGKIRSYFRVV